MAKATTRQAAAKAAQPKRTVPAKKAATTAKVPGAVKSPVAKAPAKVAKPLSKPEKPAVKVDAEAKDKPKKIKLVRDSFTMPEAEYAVLGDVKKACLKAGIEVKKSELLRVGVALIRGMETAKLKAVLDTLPALKAGRPKKSK